MSNLGTNDCSIYENDQRVSKLAWQLSYAVDAKNHAHIKALCLHSKYVLLLNWLLDFNNNRELENHKKYSEILTS